MDNLNFKRIIITAVTIFLAVIAAVNLVIFVYAFFLGFEAQGAPDPQKITRFAEVYAPIITVVASVLITFSATLWTARKIRTKAVAHGLFIAVLAALLVIIVGFIFSGNRAYDLLAGLAMILSGYMGARAGRYFYHSCASPGNV